LFQVPGGNSADTAEVDEVLQDASRRRVDSQFHIAQGAPADAGPPREFQTGHAQDRSTERDKGAGQRGRLLGAGQRTLAQVGVAQGVPGQWLWDGAWRAWHGDHSLRLVEQGRRTGWSTG